MSPRKLTEDDKHNMLELYRNSKATTSTLANEFGVSSSTVSRFLKNSLSQEEYEDLIQQKRLARTSKGEQRKLALRDRQQEAKDSGEVAIIEKPSQQIILQNKKNKPDLASDETETVAETATPAKSVRRRRKRSIATSTEEVADIEVADSTDLKTESTDSTIEETPKKNTPTLELKKKVILKSVAEKKNEEDEEDDEDDDDVDVAALSAMLGEEIDEDDEDDEEDDEDDDDGDDEEISYPHTNPDYRNLEILPLSAASFPRTCYLVVDRAAELIVKPLQEFADLGTIPDEEIQQKTLPVFDNHRIAKRFSHRREKVIKVPDGKLLQKTAQYLYEKGITRLLIRGQIYAISKG